MDPLRVQVEDLDGKGVEAYAFISSPVRVGRGDLNDLRLDRPYVSSWHGVIQFDDEGIRFIDLGSTNGTYVNGARLERNKPAAILATTELTIGRLRLVLSRGAAEGQAPPPEPVTMFAKVVAAEVAAAGNAAGGGGPGGAGGPRPEVAVFQPEPAHVAPVVEAPPPPDATVESALEAASWQLGVLHDSCKTASESFQLALDGVLTPLSDPQRRAALAAIATRYPYAALHGLAHAPPPAPLSPMPAQPHAGLPPQPVAVPLAAGGGLGGDALRLVRAFAEAYLSAAEAPATPEALQRFLGALAEALETAARGYLELRGGYEQFGREMGIRVPKGEGALARISDARQLVGWLLTPADGESRSRQLAGAFADLMIHQVALLNGVQAGARSMLDELSPDAITAAAERDGKSGLLRALKEAGLWRTFVERWHALADEESAVTDVLFGKSFARAYSAVAGRRSPTDSDSEQRATPHTRKPR
ncbi:MAG TPA: type VI secretion system-associated FHA domain protein [Anaeromyxobacter sp.]|nr:type VI secretion system-associated FHA domain protein [Anaeromyxobacter sp.]